MCEAVALARWWIGVPRAAESLALQRVALVVAADTTEHFEFEALDLEKLLKSGREVDRLPLREVSLLRALASGRYDLWHFAAHGQSDNKNPTRWKLLLGERGFLTLDDVVSLAGALRETHPMVFLNSCNSGRGVPSLAPIEGWSRRFLDAGAGTFVGSQWEISSDSARGFSRAFYRHLVGGNSLGEAMRRARLQIRRASPGDPSWLAYSLYGDPDSRACL